MRHDSFDDTDNGQASSDRSQSEPWHTFPEILQRLHACGILIHSDQLAAYMLMHGLPVDLCYVPLHLKQKAHLVNEHYQGDMARLEDMKDPYWHP